MARKLIAGQHFGAFALSPTHQLPPWVRTAARAFPPLPVASQQLPGVLLTRDMLCFQQLC